jgi:hypothetical protein
MEFPDRNPFLVLRTTVPRMTRVADVGQSGFYSTGSKRRHQRTQDVRSCKKLSFATAIVTGRYVPQCGVRFRQQASQAQSFTEANLNVSNGNQSSSKVE